MRPEEHPLYTEYRPVPVKEALIYLSIGFILVFCAFIYFMGKGQGAW